MFCPGCKYYQPMKVHGLADLDACNHPALKGKEVPEVREDSYRGTVVHSSYYRTTFCAKVNKHGECSLYEKDFNPVEKLILFLKKLLKMGR